MKYIKLFEKLGIESSIEILADKLIEKFKKETKFSFETDIFGENILIECEYSKSVINDTSKPMLAGVRPFYDIENNNKCNIFDLYTTTLDRPVIIHEVKHIHRFVKNQKQRDYINHAGQKTVSDYKHYFHTKNIAELFYDMVYYATNNEFESYYHEFYYEIEILIKKNPNKDKRELIKNFLEGEYIYQYYKYFYEQPFDLKLYFKNRNNMNNFLDKMSKNIVLYKDIDVDRMNSSKKEILISKIKKLLKLDTNIKDHNKLEKEINNKINKMVKIGFKKFQRLYTLFL